jgi:hypothetical protein
MLTPSSEVAEVVAGTRDDATIRPLLGLPASEPPQGGVLE